MENIGIGLIGCGIWGSLHAQTYSSSTLTKFVTICDQNGKKAEQFSQKYGSQNFTTDYYEVLSNPDISAVSIATPDHTHTPIVMDALKAGKHVICEKPLAKTVEEAKQLAEAVKVSEIRTP